MRVRKSSYRLDPDDPRAPPQDVWDRMSPAERASVLANLPSEFPISEAAPPEGDFHADAVIRARDVLRGFFRRGGRSAYVANDLPVYYPDEPMFAPDVIVILDVPSHPREHWTVSAEGKGLDVAMEIMWAGRRAKDVVTNVERYARLGIPEYFIFDRRRLLLSGHRLPTLKARTYKPILPQGGTYRSTMLGLDIGLEGDRLRFYQTGAVLPESAELIARLETMLGDAVARADEEARRAEEEARRAEEEARRADEAARKAEQQAAERADAERKLAAALEELARLKGERGGKRR